MVLPTQGQTFGPNIFPQGAFEGVVPTYIPWQGVDGAGNIHGLDGAQLSVRSDGIIDPRSKFGPSCVSADMNGDGFQDLVLGDSKGFFWIYLNHGTAQQPKFTQGEVLPIWLGEERLDWDSGGVESYVPRIQTVDFDGNKKFDILAGVYSGKLYRVHNTGSSTLPEFKPTYNRDLMLINTHRRGLLWNNYMAPFMTMGFSSSNLLDLITGEGTYSANSIYLLSNRNSSANPSFDEDPDHFKKIIPGMGMEQLTPVVIDWNNDGKPDVLTGDRLGYLTLFLNTSKDPSNPTFDAGTHLTIGGAQQFGGATTVSIADLTGNKLPNLIIGNDTGAVFYAVNTGKLGAPVFATPAAPLKGELPPDSHMIAPTDWVQDQAYGNAYEVISCVNPDIEKGFKFPPNQKTKFALKFWVYPHKEVFSTERYLLPVEDELREHDLHSPAAYTLNLNKTYRIHFWVKSVGNVANFRYRVRAGHYDRDGFQGYDVENPINSSSNWSEVNDEFKIEDRDDKTVTTWAYTLEIRWHGQTPFYLDDIQIQQAAD